MNAALLIVAMLSTVSAEHVERETQNGPVKATVRVEPAAPLLGDPVTLTLTVEAEAGVTVEMPGFGEALGRFSIVGFTPRDERTADGGTRASQSYVLDPPMSGRQRIPPLRIEYLDGRPGQDASEVRELLTEELAIDVQSVVTDSELTSELRERRGPLSAELRPRPLTDYLLWVGAGTAIAIVALALVLWRRGRAPIELVDPYGVADRRLRELEATGLPDADHADAWYVELSAIVRQYIENRYSIRAPELTTEEFLRAAREGSVLAPEHRDSLSAFLALCDRVKFAGLRPTPAESEEALRTARTFLDDTRPRADEEEAAPARAA